MGRSELELLNMGDDDKLDTDNLNFVDSEQRREQKKQTDVLADGLMPYLERSFRDIFLTSKLNILLPCIPFAMISNHFSTDDGENNGADGWTFIFSLLGIAPLAERLGYVTEQMAFYTNPTMGGLLNATFGNVTEMIVSVFALQSNLLRVVQLSLLGSILSNMLLVLGCAFLLGGYKHTEQSFNKDGVMANSGLLLLAVMGLSVPAMLHTTHTELHGSASELALSRFTAMLLLAIYFAYLYFQLISHREMFDEEEDDDDDDEDEDPVLGFWGSIVWLGILTIFISILSDYLVDAIEGASASWDISVAFISVVVIPIVGNAAEHASAVIFAMKNKLDISLGVAIGSSTQIALLVIPFCVLLGWSMNIPLDLNLAVFETSSLYSSVVAVAFMVSDGSSNWLKGMCLTMAYLILACSYFFHKDNQLKINWPGVNA